VPKIERTILTTAPPARVWAFLSDFTTTQQWDPPTVRTVRESGDGGVGTVYRNTSSVLGHESEITYTVIEHEAPRLMRLRGENATFDAVDTIEVGPDGDGTRVHYTADFTPTGVAKLATPLLPLGLKKLGDSAAAQMKACLDDLSD
jgi:carbon monoxide dehydrogenase subunit G